MNDSASARTLSIFEAMPITEVRAQAVAVPLAKTVATPVGTFSHHHVVVASILAGGLTGSFYAWTLSQRETDILRDMVIHVGSHLIGADAGEIASNRARMHAALRLTGRTGIGTFALGLLDACLWDLKGKAAGMPLWRLLGGTATPRYPGLWRARCSFRNRMPRSVTRRARFTRAGIPLGQDAGRSFLARRTRRGSHWCARNSATMSK